MVPDAAVAHYRAQEALAARVTAASLALWGRVNAGSFLESWAAVEGALWRIVTAGQLAAATQATAYVATVTDELGIEAPPEGAVNPAALAGVASDGRGLGALLFSPLVQAREARLALGAPASTALSIGREALGRIVATQVQDAGRTAVGVEVAARPALTGYVRMLNPPSCSRCIVLAGRRYRWSAGFLRHPRCDCRHIPVTEDVAGDLRTDPRAAFDSLTPEVQDRAFTRAGAQAIRDGADISQVVNARRGASGLSVAGARPQRTSVAGRQVFVTTEGTTVRGVAGRALAGSGTDRGRGSRYRSARTPRLTPESIYEVAEDRAEAIRLLRRFGYITT